MAFRLYRDRLKKFLLGCAKAPGLDDRKASCIKLIQRALRSSNPGSFRISPKGIFSAGRGIIALILPLSLFSIPGYYEPWGKDADLKFTPPPSQQNVSLSLMAQGMEKLIWFHQNVISTVDGPRSHYKPSSSNYMLQAIRKHGFIKGYVMGCDRLLRENNDPWIYRTAIIDNKMWKIDPPP